MTEETRTEEEFDSETSRLFRYRIQAFEKLGFSESDAISLANATVDYHRARHLKDRGATLDQLRRILL